MRSHTQVPGGHESGGNAVHPHSGRLQTHAPLPLRLEPLHKRYAFTSRQGGQRQPCSSFGLLVWKTETSPWPLSSHKDFPSVPSQSSAPKAAFPEVVRAHTESWRLSVASTSAQGIWNFPEHLEGRHPAQSVILEVHLTTTAGPAP